MSAACQRRVVFAFSVFAYALNSNCSASHVIGFWDARLSLGLLLLGLVLGKQQLKRPSQQPALRYLGRLGKRLEPIGDVSRDTET